MRGRIFFSILFCILLHFSTLSQNAFAQESNPYLWFGKTCQDVEDVLADVEINRINPLMDAADEFVFSFFRSIGRHFSEEWERYKEEIKK